MANEARRFRKKPVEVEAVKFLGSSTDMAAIKVWMDGGEYHYQSVATCDLRTLEIDTLEGTMTAQPGDWIIRGVKGEFYPCKPDIFEATYVPVESEEA